MDARVSQLGYLVFEVSDLDAWESFGANVMGFEVAGRSESELSFRFDGHSQRVILVASEADDLAVVGWQVGSAEGFRDIADRLARAGIDVQAGTPGQAEQRRVAELIRFKDPAGNQLELFHSPQMADGTFESALVSGGFVADDLGLGHLVVTSNDNDEHKQFYCDLLGFRLSDRIVANLGGFEVDLVFLHANPRHHSLAFGGRQRKRIHHWSVQVASFDDLGKLYDRMLKADVRIASTMGRHPNDKMVSFYAKTPSGFQLEVGWGGLTIDDASWEAKTHDSVSEWGHNRP